jgi:hypothetical protein
MLHVQCVETKTGRELFFREAFEGPTQFLRAYAIGDALVVVHSWSNDPNQKTRVFVYDAKTGEERLAHECPHVCSVVPSGDALLIYDVAEQWSAWPPSDKQTAPRELARLPNPSSVFVVGNALYASGGDTIVKLDRAGKQLARTTIKGATAGDGGLDRALCKAGKDLVAFMNISPENGRDIYRVLKLDPDTLKERAVVGEVKVVNFLRSVHADGDVFVVNHGSVSGVALA